MTTDTPRTHAFDRSFNLPDGSRPKDSGPIPYLETGAYLSALRFASTLERELACCRAECARLREALIASVEWMNSTPIDEYCELPDGRQPLRMARAALQVTP